MRIADLYGVPLSIVRVRTRLVTRGRLRVEAAIDRMLGRGEPVRKPYVRLAGGLGTARCGTARVARLADVCQEGKFPLSDQRQIRTEADLLKENYARKVSL